MTRRTFITLNSISTNVDKILRQDQHLTAIATHEAAHLVAAVYRNVAVREVWIKAARGSGQTIRTNSSDGRVLTLPIETDDEAFVAYAGYAWEEVNGDIKYARSDWTYAVRCGHPNELDQARIFVRNHDRLIRCMAAAMITLRDSQGWIRHEKLVDLYFWAQCRHNESLRKATRRLQKSTIYPTTNVTH